MTKLVVRELGPLFGSEVIGLEPRIPLDAETVQLLRKLFDERGLVVFRDIDIDREFQYYLSYAIIGRDVPAEQQSASPKRESLVSNKVENAIAPVGRLLWHSDMMWCEEGCELISLYGKEVGQPSPPTLFASARHAWKSLPADLRARLEGAVAEHVHDLSYERSGGDASVLTARFDDDTCARMPVAFTHPRTGETLLYICEQMTSAIAGLGKEESEALLQALFAHLYAPENVFAHEWRQGDLAMWDNMALQHSRGDVQAEGPPRTLRKTFAPMPEIFMTRQPHFARAGAD